MMPRHHYAALAGRRSRAPTRRRRAAGVAAVELALLLPMLVLMLFCLVDIARALESDLVLINLSRETANITARSSTVNPQTVMSAVSAAAPPLDMNHKGMIYVTELMGVQVGSSTPAVTRTVVIAQYRWDDATNNVGYRVSNYAPSSKIWSCSSWSSADGSCTSIPVVASAPSSSLMSGQLAVGQIIYVAESYYQFSMLFGTFKIGNLSMPTIGPNLYSMTVF